MSLLRFIKRRITHHLHQPHRSVNVSIYNTKENTMSLTATKIPSGFLVEGFDNKSQKVEKFYSNSEAANFIAASEFVKEYNTKAEYEEAAKQLPEYQLYQRFFGEDEKPVDTALVTVLQAKVEPQPGIVIDWAADQVSLVLRLITTGNSSRLRLINDELVDMGPATQGVPDDQVGPGSSEPTAPNDETAEPSTWVDPNGIALDNNQQPL